MEERLAKILASYKGKESELIPILQEVQAEFGYLPEEVMLKIARFTHKPESEVYGVATFYALFKFTRPGEHLVRVCLGTACHVKGGQRILEEVEYRLGIKSGETTKDYKFSLERVACVGCCALAPVMLIDNTVYPKMTVTEVKKIMEKY